MKTPGEMTARRLDKIAADLKIRTWNQGDDGFGGEWEIDPKKAEALKALWKEAYELARLNAGGSGQGGLRWHMQLMAELPITQNGQDIPNAAAVLQQMAKNALAGAPTGCSEAQPLQPRCPKCLGINLEIHFTDDGCQICYCRNPKCKHNAAPAEFFSAPPAMGAKLPEGKVPNYDTPETIVEHIVGMVADDGSITDYARELAIDYVRTRLLYAGGNYPPASPEQVAREIAAYVRGEFLKPLVCKPENDYLLDGLVPILQRHFHGSEGAAHRIPENENQADATCSFEFKGEVCGKILRASSYRHVFLQSEPINMFNHVFQGAASHPVAAAAQVKLGGMVYVSNQQFTGYGIAVCDSGNRKRVIGVLLENGNTWNYDAETVRNALPDELHKAPRALRERLATGEKGAEK